MNVIPFPNRRVPRVNYNGRRFTPVSSIGSGEASDATTFYYRQDGNLVWGTYSGGAIVFGTLVALSDLDGNLDLRYSHLNVDGKLMTGVCYSTPETLSDGRLRLHESWQWTSGDYSRGSSVLEEVID